MPLLAFEFSTVASGALTDVLRVCQGAFLAVFVAVLLLFLRDKRQMSRVACWTLGLSFTGTLFAAYGAFSLIQHTATAAMAEFGVGVILLVVGLIEMYRHEFLKFEPQFNPTLARGFKCIRRSTLPLAGLLASILQPPCTLGPYGLLREALSVRPGQLIEGYLLVYVIILYIPYLIILMAWYGLLSIPGIEPLKSKYRFVIRLGIGALTCLIGILLLWHTNAISLFPGIANIGG